MARRENPAAAQLLRTKFHRPALTEDLVPRDRLIRLLDQAQEVPLTLVSAGAGYGKSTLVSQWVETVDIPHAWISLDESDGDPAVFLEYLIEAVRSLCPGACPETASLLSTPEPPAREVLVACLVNELDGLASPFVLVLDDYHRLRADSEVQEVISGLLAYPPAPLHLVIATRRDPPLALSALRASGRFVEVRLQDLRFNSLEMTELLARQGRPEVGEAALAHLSSEVEGWAVGLRLTALALRHAKDVDAFLLELGGGVQQVQEYLLQEVIAAQSPEVRHWMLRSSILDRFCGELCEAVCAPDSGADSGGAEFVHNLLRSNLFTIPLDATGTWFRFHHVVQVLLADELAREVGPDELAALHLRACGWLERHGLVTEAMEHALAAGQEDEAVSVFEKHRLAAIEEDRWNTIRRWLGLLPAEARRQRVALLLAQAWLDYVRFRLEYIPALVEQAEALQEDREAEDHELAEVGFFRSVIRYWSGDAEGSRREAEEASVRIGAERSMIAGEIEIYRALSRQWVGEGEGALEIIDERIRAINLEGGAYLGRLQGAGMYVNLMSGALGASRTWGDRLVTVAKESGSLYMELWGRYPRAIVNLHSYLLEEAREDFAFVAERRDVFEKRAALDSLVGLALTCQLLGRTEEAREAIENAFAFVREIGDPAYLELAESGQARLALLTGDVAAATSWAEGPAEEPSALGMFFWVGNPALTRIRALIAKGTAASLERALGWVDDLVAQLEAMHLECHALEVLVLKSLGLEARGHGEDAQATMAEAVARGAPGGWVRPFVEAGRPGLALLHRVHEDPAQAFDVERILAAMGERGTGEGPTPVRGKVAQSLIDPLTNRELQVLELLRERLSDKEIAARLFISPQTVNFHTKHIYDKLVVNDRRQAVTMALELGVLER